MIPLPTHRCRRTRRLLPRKLRSNNKSSAAMIGAAAFFVTIVGVWLCVMFRKTTWAFERDCTTQQQFFSDVSC